MMTKGLQLELLGGTAISVNPADRGPPGPPPRPGRPGPPSPFPFPIPPGSQRELYDIQNDPNLTRQQYEDKMKQWAAKYGVKDQFDAYKKDIRSQRKRHRRNWMKPWKSCRNTTKS
ncbi:hypothetical protein ANCCAN_23592 [Ancylostoma caninum]|uniref:SXP/RAL-2 family protein Ani s 5-like cation-binding domain-containing protein n=1 Tax=Ancylostoma caninum TaxID=29170 RepID=A0A368FER6_ANCCA|nr:hypothetical protein ANCCAN_23592 [Ancylostoma caninum]